MKLIIASLAVVLSFSSAFAAKPTDGLSPAVLSLYQATAALECDAELDWPAEVFQIGPKTKLYIVPCALYAYNTAELAYIETEFEVKPVVVLSTDENGRIIGQTLLAGTGFDEKTGILSTYHKGRGLGDCGTTELTVIKADNYGDVQPRTIEVRSKTKCDGKDTAWPVVFKQK